MKAKDLMTREPVCCTADTSLRDVARMMCENDCGEIPVNDESGMKPIGVVTDRDIVCRIIAKGQNPLDITAGDCMTRGCKTVTQDQKLEECCEILEKNKIRRVVVVDDQGKCIGIISQADIARRAPKDKTAKVLQEVSVPG